MLGYLFEQLKVLSAIVIPSGTGSVEQAGRLVEELVRDVEMHVTEKLLPALRAAIGGQFPRAWPMSHAFDVACSRSGSNVTGLRRSRSQTIVPYR